LRIMTGGLRISVVIPVLNEAKGINTLIGHVTKHAKGNKIEIIVADGDPRGGTLAAIENIDVIKIVSKKGRGAQMNAGAGAAAGDVLLFLHADTFLPDDALDAIRDVMTDGKYAAGAFDLGIDSHSQAFRIIEGVASLRSRITRIPYGDQAIFMKRDIFSAMGGFKDMPIMEDVDLMQALKRSGRSIVIIPRKVRTSSRRWEAEGIIYCTLRNWALITLYMFGVSPDKLARLYR